MIQKNICEKKERKKKNPFDVGSSDLGFNKNFLEV
jgi:hypothetical protein